MRVQVPTLEFADAVAWASAVIPHRTAVPQLGCIPLRLDGDRLTLSGFDYEQSAKATVDVTVDDAAPDGPIEVMVSGRLLAEAAKVLPGDITVLTFANMAVEVKSGSSKFTLRGMPVTDYPTLPDLPQQVGTVNGALLTRAVLSTAPYVGTALDVLTTVNVDDDVTYMHAFAPVDPARASAAAEARAEARGRKVA